MTGYASAAPIFNTPVPIALEALNWDMTVSNTPVGTYLDGVEIVLLAWVNSGLRYISGSSELLVTPPTPTPAPVPATSACAALGLAVLFGLLLARKTLG